MSVATILFPYESSCRERERERERDRDVQSVNTAGNMCRTFVTQAN